jgi:hypothetical protein
MKSILAALALSGLASQAMAQAGERFDLVCTGTVRYGAETISEEPFSKHFRFDLTMQRWCDGTCQILHGYLSGSPLGVMFTEDGRDNSRGIDFLTRHLEYINNSPGFTSETKAECVFEPFSGFAGARDSVRPN